MKSWSFLAAILVLLVDGNARAEPPSDPGRPQGTVSVGFGGPILPIPQVTYERYVGLRGSVVADTGLLPLLFLNVAHVGLGYRQYFTGGPRGGMHAQFGAEGLGLVGFIGDGSSMFGASATLGGKLIARRGLTLDARLGAGVYTAPTPLDFGVGPKLAITLGSTSRSR